MAANSLVQARVPEDVKQQAAQVLEGLGLTLTDAIRMLLTRVAHDRALPLELLTAPEQHDAWFRAKVQEALEDLGPAISHDEVEARFAHRRAAVRQALADS